MTATREDRAGALLELVELNEAFAAQALAPLAEWPGLDPEIVHRRGGGYGLAALCIGVGQGIAMVVEANGET